MKIKKNALEKDITCPYCKSELTYNKKEDSHLEHRRMQGPIYTDSGKVFFGYYTDFARVIKCPCCDSKIRVD